MKPEDQINQYSGKYASKIKRICDPLNHLGIDTFWYYTLSEDGLLTYIGNQPEIADYFFCEKLYIDHPDFKSPQFLTEGYKFDNSKSGFNVKQEFILKKFSMDQIFLINEKKNKVHHGYGFATTKNNKDLSNTYINNIPLLKKFIHYFLNETDPILKSLNKNKVEIGKYVGNKFYEQNIHTPFEIEETIFREKIGDNLHLSKRQEECMDLLIKGNSANQIGDALGLSKRTIEFYLENIKNKLSCNSKQELIEKYLQHRF